MLGDFHRFPIQLNSTLLGKGSFGAWCHQVIQKLAQEKKIPVEEDEFDFLYFLSRSFGILWQLKIELLSLLLPCSVGPSPELSGPCAEKCKQITDGIFHRFRNLFRIPCLDFFFVVPCPAHCNQISNLIDSTTYIYSKCLFISLFSDTSFCQVTII